MSKSFICLLIVAIPLATLIAGQTVIVEESTTKVPRIAIPPEEPEDVAESLPEDFTSEDENWSNEKETGNEVNISINVGNHVRNEPPPHVEYEA